MRPGAANASMACSLGASCAGRHDRRAIGRQARWASLSFGRRVRRVDRRGRLRGTRLRLALPGFAGGAAGLPLWLCSRCLSPRARCSARVSSTPGAPQPSRSTAPMSRGRAARPCSMLGGGVHLQRPSVQSRLAAWEAGLSGFAERPLLGWAPATTGTRRERTPRGTGGRSRPAVSVIVPARNAEATLPAALDSILAQDYGGVVEAIVADGSDTAATRELQLADHRQAFAQRQRTGGKRVPQVMQANILKPRRLPQLIGLRRYRLPRGGVCYFRAPRALPNAPRSTRRSRRIATRGHAWTSAPDAGNPLRGSTGKHEHANSRSFL